MEMVRGVESIAEFQFGEEDIVRSKILKEIVKRYEEWKNSKHSGVTGNAKPKN
jgi:phosphate starvation-inducible protein PhoH